MWWLPLITAAMGAKNAAAKREHQEEFNKGQAEATRYSPWTGIKGQMDSSYAPSGLEGGVAGGIQGMSIQQGLEKGMTDTKSLGDQAPAAGSGVDMSAPSYLGGKEQAMQLGQDGQNTLAGMSPWSGTLQQLKKPSMFQTTKLAQSY